MSYRYCVRGYLLCLLNESSLECVDLLNHLIRTGITALLGEE